MIRPFFTIPFLLLAVGAATGVFTGNRIALVVLGLGCAAWGHAVVNMLARDPQAQLTENHPSWRHMYYLMFTLQIGFEPPSRRVLLARRRLFAVLPELLRGR